MNKIGFFGMVNLIVIILVIVGAVVSYNFFKNNFAEEEARGEDEKLEDDENEGDEDLDDEDSGENSGENFGLEKIFVWKSFGKKFLRPPPGGWVLPPQKFPAQRGRGVCFA